MSESPALPRPGWSPRLCLWHWLLARVALLLAFALALTNPDGVCSSPLHPTTLACAHLVVLGFLITQLVGAFAMVAPLVLRAPLRADWRDVVLLVSVLLTASGVASHMALGTYSGVAWSGALLLVALLLRLPSWCASLVLAPAPLPLRCGAVLAWLALPLVVCLGMALAIDRTQPFLPGGHQAALFGHAHLGAGGCVLLMVVSLGQRLLPMFLPAAPPRAGWSWAAVGLVALGTFGLGLALPFGSPAGPFFAGVLALGVLAFLFGVVGMLRARRPPPLDRRRPDPDQILVATALVSLLVALVLGLRLAFGHGLPPGELLTYGALALLGTLGSMALGLGGYLLPLAGWRDAATVARDGAPAAPRRVRAAALQWTTAVTWPLGIGVLSAGLWQGSGAVTAVGLGLLSAGVLADLANCWLGYRRRVGQPAGPPDARLT